MHVSCELRVTLNFGLYCNSCVVKVSISKVSGDGKAEFSNMRFKAKIRSDDTANLSLSKIPSIL